jgi:hypothetical protein
MDTRVHLLERFRSNSDPFAAMLAAGEADPRVRKALHNDPESTIRIRWGDAAWHDVLRFADQRLPGRDEAGRPRGDTLRPSHREISLAAATAPIPVRASPNHVTSRC